ncbi:hypothetical protein B0F90DRAFT_285372 [Multifurca ochricompacta]|uniref:Uncharacterized protein n=1 Tax=Multifurca ochricompacta TaxID=376703 RepID=A0AAD4QFM3_9AGAM|nr:hypothetical protein B0F90DRAFT_285372 [Multifurca ochricompacta]
MSEGVGTKDFITVVKVLHFIDGVKVWYFLSNLDFDWKLFYGKRPLRWPGLIYLASRFTSIACVVSFLVGLDASSQINCQAWISTAFIFPLLEFELALLLIVVRVIAIWKCSNLIIGLTVTVLAAHSGASLLMLTGIRAFWSSSPDYAGCVVRAPFWYLIGMSIATTATYAFLLLAMLIGLLQQRSARPFGVWNMLCQQGWTWFALAVAVEVPTFTLLILNINSSINLILQIPRVVIASIGTTVMFRMLYNYNSGDSRELNRPMNILRLRPDSSTDSASSGLPSPPFKQLRFSVNAITTTAGFNEFGTKEGIAM